MPRPPRFTDDDILDAAQRCVAEHGDRTTIAEVAGELDGPVGSIYHRFASRDELLVRLWLRAIRRFHEGLLSALDVDDAHTALIAGAGFTPRYCDSQPGEAIAMRLYSRQRLLGRDLPDQLLVDIDTVNDTVLQRITALAAERFDAADEEAVFRTDLAVRITPYGMVRPYLGGRIPPLVQQAAMTAADAILRAGDPS